MSDNLSQKKCVPCEVGMPALSLDEAKGYLEQASGWEIVDDGKKIKREFKFDSFMKSIEFINKVAELADHEGHHPDIHIYYKKVLLELTTHNIGGLSENDFILAVKINNL